MDSALAVVASRADECLVSELVQRALLEFEGAVTGLFVPTMTRFVATTNSTTAGKLMTAWSADTGGKLLVTPRGAQVGKSLYWEVVSNSLPGDLFSVLTNDYQKRTAWGLISTGTGWCLKQAFEPLVLVDQTNGLIGFCDSDGQAASSMGSFSATGETVAIKFEPAKGSLIFE